MADRGLVAWRMERYPYRCTRDTVHARLPTAQHRETFAVCEPRQADVL